MMTFQRESVKDVWGDVMPLARQHHRGTKNFRRHEPFKPLLSRYLAIENVGMFRGYTARCDGAVVGYFGIYVMPSMHSQLLTATEDTFFIHPDHRKGFNALRFIRYVEQDLWALGVHEILFSHETDNFVAGRLLDVLKYESVIHLRRKLNPNTCAYSAHDHHEVDDVRPNTASCS